MTNDSNIKNIFRKVFILESDQGMQKLISNYMKEFGAESIHCFADNEEALKEISKAVPDLIILDWKSKKPSGQEVYNSIRTNKDAVSTRIILTSGSITKDEILHTIRDKYAKFILKPFSEEVIFKALDDLSNGALKAHQTHKRNIVVMKGKRDDSGLDLSIHKSQRATGGADDFERMKGSGEFSAKEEAQKLKTGGDLQVTADAALGFEIGTESGAGSGFEFSQQRSLDSDKSGSLGKEAHNAGDFQATQSRNSGLSTDGRDRSLQSSSDFEQQTESSRGPDQDSASSASPPAVEQTPPMSPSLNGSPNTESGKRKENEPFGKEAGTASIEKPRAVESGRADDPRNRNRGDTAFDALQDASDDSNDNREDPNDNGEDSNDRGEAGSEDKSSEKLDEIEINLLVATKISALKSLSIDTTGRALVVDSDIMLVTTLKKYLTHLGFNNVDTYVTGNEAWDALQNETYQIIVMDWKLRGVSGLSLYNRIRSHPRMNHTPTVILCGFAGKEDFRILEEISSTSFLEKPFQYQIFEKAMKSTSVCSSLDAQLSEIAGLIIDHSKADNADLLKEIVTVGKKTGYQFKFLVASGSYFMHLRKYLLAEAIWELATKISPKSIMVMTELAKTNLRLNRPVKSLALLDQADRFAPGNIERLCLMGESGLALLQTDKARAFFERALQIDSDQPVAQAGLTVASNLKEYLEVTKENKPFNLKLASTLNVVGMAFIRNNQVDKGIEQYKSALCFVHDPATLSRLQFNLGLAYLRKGDRNSAQNYMFESMANADSEFLKPEIFHSKIISGMAFRTLADYDYADTLDLSDSTPVGLTV